MNSQQTNPSEDLAFHLFPAALRSLRWGFVATVLIALLFFVPGVGIVPYLVIMASAALLSLFAVPSAAFEQWSIVTAVILCTLVFAAFRLVHLFFLHQLAHSK